MNEDTNGDIFRTLVEDAGDGMVVFGIDGIINYANKYLLNLGGYQREDVIGHHFTEFVSEKSLDTALTMFEKALEGIVSPTTELELIGKDGEPIPVGYKGNLIYEGDEITGIRAIIRDIADRKKVDELKQTYWEQLDQAVQERTGKLKESEERFRQVAESAGEWIWEVDANGLYTYASPVMENILGYKPEEVVGKKHFYDFFTSDVREDLKEAAFEVFTKKESFKNFYNPNLHKDGRTIILETSGGPILDENGILLGYRGVDTDVTKRKKSETALQESEEKYRNLVERANDAIVIIKDQNVVFVNKKVEEIFGYGSDEIIGKNFVNFVAEGSKESLLERYKARMAGMDISPIYEAMLLHKNGTPIPVEINAGIIQFEGETVDMTIIRDLSERKLTEKALRASEERLTAMFQASQDGIGVEKDGLLVFVNPAFSEMFGYEKQHELSGMTLETIIHPKDIDRVKEYTSKRIKEEFAPTRYEFTGIRRDGSSFDVEASISKYVIDEHTFMVGFIRDITEQKKHQEELIRSRILEAQYELKSVITDLLPVLAESIEKEARKEFINRLSMELDAVLSERYYEKMEFESVEDAANAYMKVMSDLGADGDINCVDDDLCIVHVKECPWGEDSKGNLALCILCRGIVGRFAHHTAADLDVKLEETMADGNPTCKLLMGERTTVEKWQTGEYTPKKKKGFLR